MGRTAAQSALTQTLPRAMQVHVTAGGLLWRRRNGEAEICLLASPERMTAIVPRGRVHEDERLEDAAVRAVFDLTGYLGRPDRQLARGEGEDGEVAYFFLLHCPTDERFVNAARKITAVWMPLARALDAVSSDAERAVIRRAAQALHAPELVPPAARAVARAAGR